MGGSLFDLLLTVATAVPVEMYVSKETTSSGLVIVEVHRLDLDALEDGRVVYRRQES